VEKKQWLTQEEAAASLNLSIRRVLEYCAAGIIETNPPKGARWNGVPAKTLLRSDVERLAAKRAKKSKAAELRAINTCDREKMIEILSPPQHGERTIVTNFDAMIAPVDGPAVYIMCKWVSLEQASKIVGLSRRLLRSRILAGKLPALRDEARVEEGKEAQPGDCWRVKVSDLQAIAGDIQATSAGE
jgi:hypothetical protein